VWLIGRTHGDKIISSSFKNRSSIEAFSLVIGRPGFTIRIHEIESEGIIHNGREYHVSAIEADHDIASWSFIIEENPRSGRFNPDIVKSIGIPEGPLWKRLQKGLDIELEDGRVIRSTEVVGPPRKGRKIAYSGDTKPTGKFAEAVEGAEVLIHEATFDNALIEKAKCSCHSTSVQAAEVARAANVETLVLTHISSRYTDPTLLLEQAIEIFPSTILAEDLMVLDVAY